MTHDEIYQKVADDLVQALGVSRSEIAPETSIVGDLEAESIDFLDIVFRLEKTFRIEVGRGELFPQELLRDPALVTGGRVTEAGVEAVRERFRFTDLTSLEPGMRVDEMMNDLLTVRTIVDYVGAKLAAASAAAETA